MAVTAEIHNLAPVMEYTFVDSIPEAAIARQSVRFAAQTILDTRRLGLEHGEVSDLPLPIDALSTANKVLEAGHIFGEDSPEHAQRSKGLLLDCQRLVAEWYRKKKPEYFPPVRHVFDEDTEEFFSHGLSVRQMTENALRPLIDDPEEEARRVNERVEDATPQILRGLGVIAMGTDAIRTLSECTDKAISDYQADINDGAKHRGYGGYVPEIEKLMIRDIKLDAQSNDRFEEQVGVPGLYITHDIIQEALKLRGSNIDSLDKTGLHGTQLLVHDDLLEFVELLDTVASKEWCVEIFMGEVVAKGTIKDYANFRQEALRRQDGLKDLARAVAVFVMDLAEDGVDPRTAPAKVEEFVKKLLLKLAKENEIVAEQIFDKKTAVGLRAVAHLEAQGRYEEAFQKMQEVEKAAPGGGYCSGGSCGLEGLDRFSKKGRELADKVKAEKGDEVVKDKERSCKCGRKGTVIYAYSKNKVNKYCTGCHAFESKTTKLAA